MQHLGTHTPARPPARHSTSSRLAPRPSLSPPWIRYRLSLRPHRSSASAHTSPPARPLAEALDSQSPLLRLPSTTTAAPAIVRPVFVVAIATESYALNSQLQLSALRRQTRPSPALRPTRSLLTAHAIPRTRMTLSSPSRSAVSGKWQVHGSPPPAFASPTPSARRAISLLRVSLSLFPLLHPPYPIRPLLLLSPPPPPSPPPRIFSPSPSPHQHRQERAPLLPLPQTPTEAKNIAGMY
ncbi:hypothetical protein C2E23DRAFT_462016 [Lenzites betulinus]|nr:hypothetical protein C2E23DRAFT_462016 [Lenzites betulinus]